MCWGHTLTQAQQRMQRVASVVCSSPMVIACVGHPLEQAPQWVQADMSRIDGAAWMGLLARRIRITLVMKRNVDQADCFGRLIFMTSMECIPSRFILSNTFLPNASAFCKSFPLGLPAEIGYCLLL